MVLASGVILMNFRFWPVWLTNFLKFKNFFCLRSPQLYGQLMPKIRFFRQTYHMGTRAHYVSDPEND